MFVCLLAAYVKDQASPTSKRNAAYVFKYPDDLHLLSKSPYRSLDVITNSIFEDLMIGKHDSKGNFDEFGILDPESKSKVRQARQEYRH